MKLSRITGVLIAVLFTSFSATAQTAEDIIAKHIEALGGKDLLSKINSMYTESTISVMGNEAPSITYYVNGKAFRNEIDFNGQQIVQVVTDTGGWAINPMMGSTSAEPMPEEQYKNAKMSLFIGGPFFNYAEKGNKVELVGKEGNDHKLKVTSPEKADVYFLIDPSTYLINKMITTGEMQGQTMEISTSFSDYRKVGEGFMVAYKTSTDLGQFVLDNLVNKVEINKDIDMSVFAMPKQ